MFFLVEDASEGSAISTLQEGSRLTLRLDERKSKLHRKKTVEATMTTEEVQGLILATAGGYTG